MRKIAIIGLTSAILATRLALSEAAQCLVVQERRGTRRSGPKEQQVEPIIAASYSYPSDRKSKGEKKRAASARRKKGWQ